MFIPLINEIAKIFNKQFRVIEILVYASIFTGSIVFLLWIFKKLSFII